jgi:hypothetical protein
MQEIEESRMRMFQQQTAALGDLHASVDTEHYPYPLKVCVEDSVFIAKFRSADSEIGTDLLSQECRFESSCDFLQGSAKVLGIVT